MFKPERFQLGYAWIIKIRIKLCTHIRLSGFVICVNHCFSTFTAANHVMVGWSHLYKKHQKASGSFLVCNCNVLAKSSTHVSNEHVMLGWWSEACLGWSEKRDLGTQRPTGSICFRYTKRGYTNFKMQRRCKMVQINGSIVLFHVSCYPLGFGHGESKPLWAESLNRQLHLVANQAAWFQ